MRRAVSVLMVAMTIILAATAAAQARLRATVEDAQLVQNNELVVVGHLLKGSVKYVPREVKPDEGRSWHHTATLVVTETLKGKTEAKEIPIVIHYGLNAKVGGVWLSNPELNRGAEPQAGDVIEIWDSSHSRNKSAPLVKDAGQDNLWFLRRGADRSDPTVDARMLGIADPEQLQPLELKDYFLAYLSANPEKEVAAFLAKKPALKERIQRYLDHQEIQRILKLPDAGERAAKLVPFYAKRIRWGYGDEAAEALVAAGPEAGPALLKVFQDPANRTWRATILLLWGRMGWKDAAAVIVALLDEHDAYWAAQDLQGRRWDAATDEAVLNERRRIEGETYYGLVALTALGERQARPAVERTQRRWSGPGFGDGQVLEECVKALDSLPKEK